MSNRAARRAAARGKRGAVFSMCLSGGCGCGLPTPEDAPELAGLFGLAEPAPAPGGGGAQGRQPGTAPTGPEPAPVGEKPSMLDDPEVVQMFRDFGPVLVAWAEELGSWRALGREIARRLEFLEEEERQGWNDPAV